MEHIKSYSETIISLKSTKEYTIYRLGYEGKYREQHYNYMKHHKKIDMLAKPSEKYRIMKNLYKI